MRLPFLLSLFLSATAIAQTYNLQSHGQPCGARLAAHLVSNNQHTGVRLGIHSRPISLTILAVGHPQPAPVTLPGGHCRLFVDPRATVLTMTNIHGNAVFNFPLPPVVPIHVLFQGIVANLSPAGLVARSSNVISLHGQ